ncbi:MAG TPA: antitoxin Xre/MbcA/ParS toxin-binding domain-containing protein [Thermoanaerobaculia bacterium]|nr:antitoxin Xre/MbcA/ParS toxin-binding domain-containing protein [Thermoanaerobaculia bacterium]
MQLLVESLPSAPAVLSKALERAAELLGFTDREIAGVLGVSPSSVSRLFHGTRTIDPQSKEGELALLLLRVFRSLDGLLGGDGEQSRRWLRAHNHHLAGVPADLLQTAHGLVRVADYLDALRGHG